jgi:hypothetical protein
MPRYSIITLVDITRTNAVKTEVDQLKILQQSNFNSLRQTIELRSNITWIKDPIESSGRLPEGLDGKAVFWQWEFEVEREDLFLKEGDPVGHLLNDLHNVPIITGLRDTAEIKPAAFQTKGESINTIVKVI